MPGQCACVDALDADDTVFFEILTEGFFAAPVAGDIAAFLSGGFFTAGQSEQIDRGTRIREFIMMGLRLSCGLSLARFCDEFAVPLFDLIGETMDRHRETGLLWMDNGAVGPTEKGLDLLNTTLRDAFRELQNLTPAPGRW